MAGWEQHQSLRLKQLKVPHCPFCPVPLPEADVPGAPGWDCHAWSGPRPGPQVTLLGGSISALSTVTVPSSPHFTATPDPGWGRGVGWCGGPGQPNHCGTLSNGWRQTGDNEDHRDDSKPGPGCTSGSAHPCMATPTSGGIPQSAPSPPACLPYTCQPGATPLSSSLVSAQLGPEQSLRVSRYAEGASRAGLGQPCTIPSS